jgi:predicted DNA-binding transcriptional regulator YafY
VLETSARLLRLLSLLQSRRDWSGNELADRLEVTTRTVRNDIDRLRNLGYPVEATRGAAGGYRLGVGAVTPPLLLDDDEAVAIAVALSTAASSSVSGIEELALRALAKVEQLLPPHLRRRVSALQRFTVPAPATGPAVDSDTLTVIAACCRDLEGLRFDYRNHAGAATRRSVEPHRLVHVRRRWYLVAWDIERDDWRTFRVDRVTIPTNHSGPRFTPRDLPSDDLADHVERGIDTSMWEYRATVLVRRPAATIRRRLPAAVHVEAVDDESCTIEVGSEDAHVLALYLGMLDADFTILRGAEHPELLDHLGLLADRYRRAVDGSTATAP